LVPHLILVGGFLGAGKTTLLLAAGARLRGMGHRVGIILNDQGAELVDTRMAAAAGLDAQEITGGCFCCRFSEFISVAERFAGQGAPDFILAEPVGSCTDLSATIMQPIKRFYGDRFQLAPLTVLVDPERAEDLLRSDADSDLSYLFRKQIAEADLVRFSKADRRTGFPELPGVHARPLSARTGAGVAEWLDEVLSGKTPSGGSLLEIDYELYAQAEAALGWLNWRGELRFEKALTPAAAVGPLLSNLDRLLTDAGIAIAHLKVFARSTNGYVRAGICRNGDKPSVEGRLDAPPSKRYALTINLRAVGPPEMLNALIDRALNDGRLRVKVEHREAFRPSPPVPEHRFEAVV
jgi:hypothetical protein